MGTKLTPLVTVVGPTASGKTALAIELAEKFQGEIICADSRTVYKGMDIGTAKPSHEERKRIPHHLLDVVQPDQEFNVADFKRLAEASISDIQASGKLPIMVGGSGLYIDSVLFDYKFAAKDAPRDTQNPRHLSKEVHQQKSSLRPQTLIIGLDVNRNELKTRIEKRVDVMVQAGLVEEVEQLLATYPHSKALLAPGYKAFAEFVQGRLSLDEAKALFIQNDRQLAKRQRTWFKRNKSIHWLSDPKESVAIVTTFLNNL